MTYQSIETIRSVKQPTVLNKMHLSANFIKHTQSPRYQYKDTHTQTYGNTGNTHIINKHTQTHKHRDRHQKEHSENNNDFKYQSVTYDPKLSKEYKLRARGYSRSKSPLRKNHKNHQKTDHSNRNSHLPFPDLS